MVAELKPISPDPERYKLVGIVVNSGKKENDDGNDLNQWSLNFRKTLKYRRGVSRKEVAKLNHIQTLRSKDLLEAEHTATYTAQILAVCQLDPVEVGLDQALRLKRLMDSRKARVVSSPLLAVSSLSATRVGLMSATKIKS